MKSKKIIIDNNKNTSGSTNVKGRHRTPPGKSDDYIRFLSKTCVLLYYNNFVLLLLLFLLELRGAIPSLLLASINPLVSSAGLPRRNNSGSHQPKTMAKNWLGNCLTACNSLQLINIRANPFLVTVSIFSIAVVFFAYSYVVGLDKN